MSSSFTRLLLVCNGRCVSEAIVTRERKTPPFGVARGFDNGLLETNRAGNYWVQFQRLGSSVLPWEVWARNALQPEEQPA